MTREPKWRRRSDARPEEIVEAALAVFAEKGFSAARLDDLAKGAGVSKGTLYLYFADKEALFKAVVQRYILAAVGELEARLSVEHRSAPDVLLAVGRTMGRTLLHGPAGVIPKLVVAEAGNFPDLVTFYMEEVVARGLAVVGRQVARGVAEGDFAPIEPALGARLLLAPVAMMAIWRHSFALGEANPMDPDLWLDTHLTVTLAGLRAGGRTTP
jgi:AcrR family transcriptional regulator